MRIQQKLLAKNRTQDTKSTYLLWTLNWKSKPTLPPKAPKPSSTRRLNARIGMAAVMIAIRTRRSHLQGKVSQAGINYVATRTPHAPSGSPARGGPDGKARYISCHGSPRNRMDLRVCNMWGLCFVRRAALFRLNGCVPGLGALSGAVGIEIWPCVSSPHFSKKGR